AQRVDERLVVDQFPELLRAAACERVLDVDRAAQPDDVLSGIAALYSLPAGIFRPVLLEPCCFQIVVHLLLPSVHRGQSQRLDGLGTLVDGARVGLMGPGKHSAAWSR